MSPSSSLYLAFILMASLLSICGVWIDPREDGHCLQLSDVHQLPAAGVLAGSDVTVSAAVFKGVTSLLVSTESSCMESVASCTALLSSERQTRQVIQTYFNHMQLCVLSLINS